MQKNRYQKKEKKETIPVYLVNVLSTAKSEIQKCSFFIRYIESNTGEGTR